MKILTGKWKGRNIYMPAGIRPTSNLLRKALFDILGHDLDGVSFLDLFAGSGAVGLEALSSGAQTVIFVEKDLHCSRVIEDNLRLLKVPLEERVASRVQVLPADAILAIKALAGKGKKFDFVFADPPYGWEWPKKILKTLGAYDIVHADCRLIFQSEKKEILPSREGRFLLYKSKSYGKSILYIYEAMK